jgi:hemerythrin-like domain-containing protein
MDIDCSRAPRCIGTKPFCRRVSAFIGGCFPIHQIKVDGALVTIVAFGRRRGGEHMQATEVLSREHRVIEVVLGVLEKAADALDRGREVPRELLEKSLDFIRGFADTCHHAKEEELLFPTLQQRGIPSEGGPVGVMLHEHEMGRGFVRGASEAFEAWSKGDRTKGPEIARNLRGYVQVLRQHIYKEDNILFPMGDKVLDEADNARLVERFEEIENERIGAGKHEEYHELVHELEHMAEEL